MHIVFDIQRDSDVKSHILITYTYENFPANVATMFGLNKLV